MIFTVFLSHTDVAANRNGVLAAGLRMRSSGPRWSGSNACTLRWAMASRDTSRTTPTTCRPFAWWPGSIPRSPERWPARLRRTHEADVPPFAARHVDVLFHRHAERAHRRLPIDLDGCLSLPRPSRPSSSRSGPGSVAALLLARTVPRVRRARRLWVQAVLDLLRQPRQRVVVVAVVPADVVLQGRRGAKLVPALVRGNLDQPAQHSPPLGDPHPMTPFFVCRFFRMALWFKQHALSNPTESLLECLERQGRLNPVLARTLEALRQLPATVRASA